MQQQCDDHLPLQTAAKVAFETARTTLTTNRELFKCVRAKDIECKAARASVLDAKHFGRSGRYSALARQRLTS